MGGLLEKLERKSTNANKDVISEWNSRDARVPEENL
jgi:hypothetical protein